jgi:hypothetical protein
VGDVVPDPSSLVKLDVTREASPQELLLLALVEEPCSLPFMSSSLLDDGIDDE